MQQDRCPNCHQCTNFQVTHDARAPLACRQFGFKSRQLPSLEVLVTTGKQCIFFEQKAFLSSSSSPAAIRPGNSICYTA